LNLNSSKIKSLKSKIRRSLRKSAEYGLNKNPCNSICSYTNHEACRSEKSAGELILDFRLLILEENREK